MVMGGLLVVGPILADHWPLPRRRTLQQATQCHSRWDWQAKAVTSPEVGVQFKRLNFDRSGGRAQQCNGQPPGPCRG